jgi:4-azaleucine resistance transporter AzlC
MTDFVVDNAAAPERPARSEFARGVAAALPMMLGFVPIALVLGSQATHKGFAAWEVPVMTGLNFAGGSEFAAVGLWTSPPNVLLIATIAFLVNSRHLLMGAAFAPLLKRLPAWKALSALFLMCDESWAMGLADARRRKAGGLSLPYYLGVAISLYATWVASTALGAIVGPALGDVTRYGFDMAFPAVFFAMLAGMWRGVAAARPWLVSLTVGGATHVFVPGAWYVPAGALSGVAAAYVLARRAP